MSRSSNKLGPSAKATGDHSTFKKDSDGTTTNYRTYEQNSRNPSGFQEVKGYDGIGKSHGGVDTPHVHENGHVRKTTDSETPGSSSGSGCFITTACVKSLGLPDDCYELTILRGFRDTYMKSRVDGEVLIDKYYNIAPLITDKINTLDNNSEIWTSIFKDLVEYSVELIEKGSNEEAMKHYKAYIESLSTNYLVS